MSLSYTKCTILTQWHYPPHYNTTCTDFLIVHSYHSDIDFFIQNQTIGSYAMGEFIMKCPDVPEGLGLAWVTPLSPTIAEHKDNSSQSKTNVEQTNCKAKLWSYGKSRQFCPCPLGLLGVLDLFRVVPL